MKIQLLWSKKKVLKSKPTKGVKAYFISKYDTKMAQPRQLISKNYHHIKDHPALSNLFPRKNLIEGTRRLPNSSEIFLWWPWWTWSWWGWWGWWCWWYEPWWGWRPEVEWMVSLPAICKKEEVLLFLGILLVWSEILQKEGKFTKENILCKIIHENSS